MKRLRSYIFLCLLSALLSSSVRGQSYGRVVINEYMPWTSNGCGPTAEFVELLNFGPGPVNIGCHIITDGDYTITIPPNTILQPGEYYVLAGQDVIPRPCANINTTIRADLNWNTCGCTSARIPTTGDGLFTDGGTANEQVVLLDPSLKVIDAVVRSLPGEVNNTITTAMGGCNSYTFNLDTMSVNYEVLGMSTGRGNSFARKVDGDCGWVKDPQQSASVTNNNSGDVSDADYSFSIVNSSACNGSFGSVDIALRLAGYTDIFPMSYTIAYDKTGEGNFDFSDDYTYGVDSSAPSIFIDGLIAGRYRITVASAKGCYLQSFEFTILGCTYLLPLEINYFKQKQRTSATISFEWLLTNAENAASVQIQKSKNGITFIPQSAELIIPRSGSTQYFTKTIPAETDFHFYRIAVKNKDGRTIYSNIISTTNAAVTRQTAWPNPVNDKLYLSLASEKTERLNYTIYNLQQSVMQGEISLAKGDNLLQLPVSSLLPGVYQLLIRPKSGHTEPISFRFVKQ